MKNDHKSPEFPANSIHTSIPNISAIDPWLPLSQFLSSLCEPSSWHFVCERAMQRSYKPNAPSLFRFFDMMHDPHCIVRCMASEACDLCCIYASKDGLMEITYLGNDRSSCINVNDRICVRENEAVALLMKRGIVVLMKTNASYRLWDSNKSSATATAISSFSDHCNVQQDLGRFLVICNPLRRERACSACDVVWFSSMPKCGRCKSVRYCSRFCQKRHWTEHRQVCRNVIVHTYNNNDRKIRNGKSRKNCCNAWKPDTIGQSWHDERDPLYDYEKKNFTNASV